MELTVRGKNLEITEALRTYVEKHTGKIQRYFDKPIKINVLLRISNMTKTCEVTAFVDGVILRGVEKSDDMYKSIDLVFDKVERQIHKYKTKLMRGRYNNFREEAPVISAVPAEEPEFKVVRNKRFIMRPMGVEEAIMQMNLLNHDFFVFFDEEIEAVNVVYRRKDGDYGLLSPELK